MKKRMRWIKVLVLAGTLTVGLGSVGFAEEATLSATAAETSAVRTVGLGAAAAFAIALSVLGAGYAVGRIGAAALGAAAEKPELLTRSILFVALAEGLAVLGFAIAMMLLQKI
jgi:V/A-type H+/Na+-transporting ATPase subunit K